MSESKRRQNVNSRTRKQFDFKQTWEKILTRALVRLLRDFDAVFIVAIKRHQLANNVGNYFHCRARQHSPITATICAEVARQAAERLIGENDLQKELQNLQEILEAETGNKGEGENK